MTARLNVSGEEETMVMARRAYHAAQERLRSHERHAHELAAELKQAAQAVEAARADVEERRKELIVAINAMAPEPAEVES